MKIDYGAWLILVRVLRPASRVARKTGNTYFD
jgi:hypothetical protein